MHTDNYNIRQLIEELAPPESGKRSVMVAKTPHSIAATAPLVMLLTLLK